MRGGLTGKSVASDKDRPVMRSILLFLLSFQVILVMAGCQGTQPQPTPTQAPSTATPAPTPQKTASFTVEVLEGPTKPVEIWLEGPTKEERTAQPGELSQTFKLAEGVYNLTVRSEGYQNFALKVQIPEMDSVKAAMTPLPEGQVPKNRPVNDPFAK